VPEPAIPPAPKSNPGTWATPKDYPIRALRNRQEGRVGFRLTVEKNGQVSSCANTKSSSVVELDETTCQMIVQRAEFTPAFDEEGMPIVSTWSNSVRWQIPKGPREVPREGHLSVVYVVEKDGTVSSCELEEAEGASAERNYCDGIHKFAPLLDENGKPQRKLIRFMTRIVQEDLPQ